MGQYEMDGGGQLSDIYIIFGIGVFDVKQQMIN